MPQRALRLSVLGLGLLVALHARADSMRPVSIWYRSAAACPDAPAFLARLAARDVAARLAQVGDAIDFVITLGSAEGQSSGVLERQTGAGTVAIRRVDDASCEQVADALALTLALAIQAHPSQADRSLAETQASAPTDANESTIPPASAPTPTPASASRSEPTPTPARTPAVAGTRAPVTAEFHPTQAPQWWLGAQGIARFGIVGDMMPGADAFAELDFGGSGLMRPALRLGVSLSAGSHSYAARDLSVLLMTARLGGCPVAIGNGALTARPCLGLELGQIRAEGEGATARSDHGLWAAVSLLGRVRWLVAAPLALHAEIGLHLPLTRYQLLAGSADEPVERTETLGFAGGLGVVVRLP